MQATRLVVGSSHFVGLFRPDVLEDSLMITIAEMPTSQAIMKCTINPSGRMRALIDSIQTSIPSNSPARIHNIITDSTTASP
jgi:hypothetical protein